MSSRVEGIEGSGGAGRPGLKVWVGLLREHFAFGMLLLCVTVALWSLLRQGTPIATDQKALTPAAGMSAFLKSQQGLLVSPEEVVFFEPPEGRRWTEGLGFVPAFVLGKRGEESEADLYYLEARLDARGVPLEVRRLSNLTETPYARERLVASEGPRVLLSMEVFGQIQSLLLVDFSGDERELPEFESTLDMYRYKVTNIQETGRYQGVGLRLFGVDPPAEEVIAEVEEGTFDITLRGGSNGEEESEDARLLLHPDLGHVVGVTEGAAGRLTYKPRYYASKDRLPWLVDTVRNHPLVGPRKIALLEKFVFYWKDRLRGAAFSVGLISEDGDLMSELGEQEKAGGGPSIAVELTKLGEGEWPPPPVKSALASPKRGEGEWRGVDIPWLRTLEGAPAAFVKTAVRMDPKRPYSHLVLIAMDMRQLDLGMVGGTITPASSYGTPGTGMIPREERKINRLVATFNGGFKTAHGAFGMQVSDKVILPAMPELATIAVQKDGQVKMGAWNNSMTIPKSLDSFRQNLPPLIADGKLNPTGKRKWGGTANELDAIHTTRSGVCMRGQSTLIYVWGDDTSADAIGSGMLAAGCEFGMHLDMNPTHTGWSFYRAELKDASSKGWISEFKVEKGSKRMKFREGRYMNRDVKDFFYLTLRETFDARLSPPPAGFGRWVTADAPKGQEGFLPIGAVSTGTSGEIVVMDLNALKVKLRRGDREPDPSEGLGSGRAPKSLNLKDPVLVLDLGVSKLEGSSGFISEGRIIAPIPGNNAALVRYSDGALDVVGPSERKKIRRGSFTDMRGGPALLVGGKVVKSRTSQEVVHALGVDAARRLFYMKVSGSRSEAAKALQKLGVVNAMVLPAADDSEERLKFIQASEGRLEALSPRTGKKQAMGSRQETTQLYLERSASSRPRVARLSLAPEELSEEEAKRQQRLQHLLKTMRLELWHAERAKNSSPPAGE